MNVFIGTNEEGVLGISLSPYDFSRVIDHKQAEWYSIPVWEHNGVFYQPNIVGDYNGKSILELPSVVKRKSMPDDREVPSHPYKIRYRHLVI